MIHSAGNPLPISEILQVSVDNRSSDHERLAKGHGQAVEAIMRYTCQGAQIVRPVGKEQANVQEAIMWSIDSRIDDGRIDYATRVRAVIGPATQEVQPEGLVVPTLIRRQVYRQPWKRNDPEWSPPLRDFESGGMYLQSLAVWPTRTYALYAIS